MMSEIKRILDQMDRAFAGEAWHGPSVNELLAGITAENAAARPVRGAHSIWELVNHVAAWNGIVQRRAAGESVKVTPEQDWPPVREANEAAWKRALDEMKASRARLRGTVEKMRDDQLDQRVPGEEYSNYFMVHGLIQHDLYHAGQIAILKKALG